MLKRKMYDTLLEWKARKHKCLLLTGQRQVGKTYLVEAFADAEYKNHITINFSDSPQLESIFEGDITAEEILRRLTLHFGSDSIVEGETLLFLDEIQDGKRAFAALKQLSIYGKIDVIASGSLLGVRIPQMNGKGKSETDSIEALMPMGYEEPVVMYPMDFEEYLWARGISDDIISGVRACIHEKQSIDSATYERLTSLYREFLIVGGMPEAVREYVETRDFRPVSRVQAELVSSCIRDINRYNSGNDRIRTAECFESIPYQLADTNRKFMYSRIAGESGRRSSDKYMENLLWIKGAGYGNFCYGVTQPALPIGKNVKRDLFKVYLSDTGLLLQMYGDKARLAAYNGDHSYNFGAVAENAVANNLVKNGLKLFYYVNKKGEGKMELDFLTEFWSGIAAIEVKSGAARMARSLSKVNDYFPVKRRIMFEESNIRVDEEGIEHYPLFASAFIKDMDEEHEGPTFSY
ncbi:MAG: AAA family ATPase [archaeon]|nr:AAA family ATPase [archaeon]